MIEASTKYWRGPPIVLSCAQDDDGINRSTLILLAHNQYGDESRRIDRCCCQERPTDCTAPGGEDGTPNRASLQVVGPSARATGRRRHRSKLSPCPGIRTSGTPSSLRMAAMASSPSRSP